MLEELCCLGHLTNEYATVKYFIGKIRNARVWTLIISYCLLVNFSIFHTKWLNACLLWWLIFNMQVLCVILF